MFFQCLIKQNFEKINFLFKIILIEIISYKGMSSMVEDLNSNNIENDEFNLNNEDIDYEDLITRLKEIKSTIALWKK